MKKKQIYQFDSPFDTADCSLSSGRRCRKRLSIKDRFVLFFWVVFVLASVFLVGFARAGIVISDGEFTYTTDDGLFIYASGNGGNGTPYVITNVWSSCTNCIAVTPQESRSMGLDINHYLQVSLPDTTNQLNNIRIYCLGVISNQLDDISTFQFFPNPSGNQLLASDLVAITNYLYNVDNGQTRSVLSGFVNYVKNPNNAYSRMGYLGAVNAVYDYANNEVKPNLESLQSELSIQAGFIEELQYFANQSLDPVAQRLLTAEDCGDGNGSPDTVFPTTITNTQYISGVGYETFLGLSNVVAHIDSDFHSALVNIIAISNRLSRLVDISDTYYRAIVGSLYSAYEYIPNDIDPLTFYYNPAPQNDFGYVPTNTLQRIELLVLQLAKNGVGGSGNNDTFDDPLGTSTNSSNSSVESDINTHIADIKSDVSAENVRSLGNRLVALFNSLSFSGSLLSQNSVIVPSYTVSVGGKSLSIPSLTSGYNIDGYSIFGNILNALAKLLYCLFACFYLYAYWIRFAKWCITFFKWSIELANSLFN